LTDENQAENRRTANKNEGLAQQMAAATEHETMITHIVAPAKSRSFSRWLPGHIQVVMFFYGSHRTKCKLP
jgi:hypothetical protein